MVFILRWFAKQYHWMRLNPSICIFFLGFVFYFFTSLHIWQQPATKFGQLLVEVLDLELGSALSNGFADSMRICLVFFLLKDTSFFTVYFAWNKGNLTVIRYELYYFIHSTFRDDDYCFLEIIEIFGTKTILQWPLSK